MKKILAVFVTLLACVSVFAVANRVVPISGFDANAKPSNVLTVKLVTAGVTADSIGPITTGAPIVYGPIALSVDPSRPEFKGFRAFFPLNAWSSGDSIRLQYQTIPSNNAADTSTLGWISVGANVALGDTAAYIDLTTSPAQSILFKLVPIDVTPVTFLKPIRVVFFAPSTESADVKR